MTGKMPVFHAACSDGGCSGYRAPSLLNFDVLSIDLYVDVLSVTLYADVSSVGAQLSGLPRRAVMADVMDANLPASCELISQRESQ
jgi:hypothetical protein